MKPWQHILLGVFLGLIASAVIYWIAIPPSGVPLELLPLPTPAPLVVQVSGAVVHPGVYSLPPGSRIEAAIFAAGGFSPNADVEKVNQAALVKDGEKISVPAVRPTPDISFSTPVGPAATFLPPTSAISAENPLNINTATVEELDALPGIGPTKAKDIVNYREQHGPFERIEDIQKVPNIGPAMFEKIKLLITV